MPAHGRAWELVTHRPPSSSKVLGVRPMDQNGEQLITSVIGPPPESASGAILNFRSVERGPLGWTGSPFGLAYSVEGNNIFPLYAPVMPIALSDDERTTLWASSTPLTPGAPPQEQFGLYRQTAGGPLEFVAHFGEGLLILGLAGFADIASDGSRVVFTSERHLLPGDAGRTEGESIYAWDGSGLELVDVDDSGTLLSTCGVQLSHYGGMSESGSRVFFATNPSCGQEKMYVRDLNTDDTIDPAVSQCTRPDCNAPAAATFAGATPDGKSVFFTTTQQLFDEDQDSGRDLYRFDVDTGELVLVSASGPAATGAVDRARAFFTANGQRVYFRASGVMIPGESTTGEKLFLSDFGGLHRVAEVSFPPAENESARLWPTPVQLSADGKQALFLTQSKVLAEDTDSAADAYLYDAEDQTVTRVSKGPSGGNADAAVSIDALSPINMHEYEFGNVRPYYAIDAAGRRAFFQTEESLVPEDTNGDFDVYEVWNGNLGLITPGYQPLESTFSGVSRDGKTVMFGTNATLIPGDVDGEGRDIYAARLGGGFAEPPPPPGCDSASCPLPDSERVSRGNPASRNATPPKKSGQLRVLGVASKAKKGAIAVTVSVPGPGTVTGQIAIKSKGKRVVLAQGSAKAKRAGKVELSLRLTGSARKAGGGAKQAQLTVSAGSSRASQAVKVSF